MKHMAIRLSLSSKQNNKQTINKYNKIKENKSVCVCNSTYTPHHLPFGFMFSPGHLSKDEEIYRCTLSIVVGGYWTVSSALSYSDISVLESHCVTKWSVHRWYVCQVKTQERLLKVSEMCLWVVSPTQESRSEMQGWWKWEQQITKWGPVELNIVQFLIFHPVPSGCAIPSTQ